MTRADICSHAQETGWTIVGHNWLRLTRDDQRIEVWFTGNQPRIVVIKNHLPGGVTITLDIVRDRGVNLPTVLADWVNAKQPANTTHDG